MDSIPVFLIQNLQVNSSDYYEAIALHHSRFMLIGWGQLEGFFMCEYFNETNVLNYKTHKIIQTILIETMHLFYYDKTSILLADIFYLNDNGAKHSVGGNMKKGIFITLLFILCYSFTGCNGTSNEEITADETVASAPGNTEQTTDQSESQSDKESADGVTETQLESEESDYDTNLKVFVVDRSYLEVQWTFPEGVAFDWKGLQLDENGPKVQLSFLCGESKDTMDMELTYRYYGSEENATSPINLSQLTSTATFAVNNEEIASFYISKELQGDTMILRVKASDGSSLDFTTFQWFRTNIYYGNDAASGTSAEYEGGEVLTDYSLNPYPNAEYTQEQTTNASQEITFEGQTFTVDSPYYTAAKFEVPEVTVFEYIWYYSKSWDTWYFEARDERSSTVTEYQITQYDSSGNEIGRETRTVFPSEEDALSCYRGVVGYSEKVQDMSISEVGNRKKELTDYFTGMGYHSYVEGNTLYNGEFLKASIQFEGIYDLSGFIPDANGYAYASVPYQYQVQGGFIDGESQMNAIVYFSDPSLY